MKDLIEVANESMATPAHIPKMFFVLFNVNGGKEEYFYKNEG